MEDSFGAIALCALGLEKVLSNEIEKLGLEPTGRSPGRVRFVADSRGLFRANLGLRTAERVLLEAARFRAPDFDALFEGARNPAWELFFARDDRLVIERVRSRDSQLTAQTSIQSVVHKAIYETLGKKYRIERLPETGRERSLRVYLEDDECVLGLDLSGEALHRRGYRKSAGEAPLKETIAASLLLLAGWRRRFPLLDPLCGTGTILIEAALFALDRAPGLDRHFEIENMPIAREGASAQFQEEREAARAGVRKDVDILLVGRDADPKVIDMARANAERAGVAPLLDLRVGKAEDARPDESGGIVLTNPPWGERLGTEAEAETLYRRLGEVWGAAPGTTDGPFAGWGLGFVTNRSDFGLFFGRRAPVEKEIINGSEEQWFHWYPAGWELRPERSQRERSERVSAPRSKAKAEGSAPSFGSPLGARPTRAPRDFGRRDRGTGGYAPRDRPPRDGAPFEKRPSGGTRDYGDRPRPPRDGAPFEKRPSGGGTRDYGDRPRPPRDGAPFEKRPSGGGTRDYGDRPRPPRDGAPFEKRPSGGTRDYGDRPRPPRDGAPYEKRPSGGTRDYGDRPRPPRDGAPSERRPREGGTRDYGDRPRPPRDGAPYEKRPSGGTRDYGDRPRPPRDGAPSERRPREGGTRDYGDRPRPPRDGAPSERRPREGGTQDYGDRPRPPRDGAPFERRPSGGRHGRPRLSEEGPRDVSTPFRKPQGGEGGGSGPPRRSSPPGRGTRAPGPRKPR